MFDCGQDGGEERRRQGNFRCGGRGCCGRTCEQGMQFRIRQRGDLTDSVALLNEAAEQNEAIDMRLTVLPAAFGTIRDHGLVAAFPGAQGIEAQPG